MMFLSMTSLSVMGAVDDGKINNMFSTDTGAVAISLTGGTPNANSENSSCLYGSSWSGFMVTEQSKMMGSMLMMAYASQKNIRIITSGCVGSWHKITNVYVLN